jgi:hypothetical protein
MIDAAQIARIFDEERIGFTGGIEYSDTPALTPEEKLARAHASFPTPALEAIARVIEEVFYASFLTEEGRPCRPRMLFAPSRPGWPQEPVHRFTAPVPLNRDTLRKLVPAQGPLGYLTWSCDSSGEPVVTGVQMHQGGGPSDLVVAAPKGGALDLTWHHFRLVAFRAGRVDRLSRYALPDLVNALRSIWSLLGVFEPMFLGQAVRAITKDGHGGSLWIVREGCPLDGVDIGHPVTPDTRPLIERETKDRFEWLGSIGHLAAVDGAVVLDGRLRVLGFGAFVRLGDADIRVHQLQPSGAFTEMSWTQTGGGRHRSAISFCSSLAPAAAIVVSEDGRTSLIAAQPKAPPAFIELGSLGLSHAL